MIKSKFRQKKKRILSHTSFSVRKRKLVSVKPSSHRNSGTLSINYLHNYCSLTEQRKERTVLGTQPEVKILFIRQKPNIFSNLILSQIKANWRPEGFFFIQELFLNVAVVFVAFQETVIFLRKVLVYTIPMSKHAYAQH